MAQGLLPVLAGWVNFYVIVGSSAGALTGLQFVVITLIANSRLTGSMQEIRAFGTPTMIHFCVALLISALMSAPWQALSDVGFCMGACGAAGLAYSIRVLWHARKAAYNPDAEDWVWYGALPLVAYTALSTAAILLWRQPVMALFMIAATTLLFLFIGVHNSWDTVTYVATQHQRKQEKSESMDQG